ncbi:GCN5 family acetyltransferase [Bhargavaea cecembensis]|uniref:GCN5 family acetyltransferase n=1 Tax=Bhargavaea cecembensis TaxID=394098 RepID=A0A163FL60_9BACL|nr:GNAT family N-acetyltransferase [Bhargavaea cecembensis]KZE38891.1 GCN5 family acetyltransferase [Bhargavaea cecembensis]
MDNFKDAFTFINLNWDTDFFGVNCAKATLHRPLTLSEWKKLKTKFIDYQFISIMNKNSEPTNAKLIGKETSAFLADVNIQFMKEIVSQVPMPEHISIQQALKRNDEIIELADFQFSRFIEDPELAIRGGREIYREWIKNSFGKLDKYFAISKDTTGKINGFLLFSYKGNDCVIELIAVSKESTKGGTGTSLFKAVEYEAYQKDCDKIIVGTQVRNSNAINFYQKVGCKQVGSHQVFHYWL